MFSRNSRQWGLVSVALVLFVYVIRSSGVLTFAGDAASAPFNVTSLFWWLHDDSLSEHSYNHADHVHHSSSLSLTENVHLTHSHRSDRFTTTHEGWPPQPKALGGVTLLTDSSKFVSREGHQPADGNTTAQESVEVRAALGARLTYLVTGGHTQRGKRTRLRTVSPILAIPSVPRLRSWSRTGGCRRSRALRQPIINLR